MAKNRYPAKSTVYRAPVVNGPASGGLVIGYVHSGSVSSYFAQSMLGTVLYDRATNQNITGIANEWSSANVSSARNRIVKGFLDGSKAQWLLFIDSDMAWDADAADRLLSVADKEKAPIVGGLCFGSNDGRLFPTLYTMGEVDGQPMTMRLQDFPEDTMFRVAATGAAFMMIHRSVLVKMRDHKFNDAFPWFQETQLGDQPVSEDITFCLRAGQVLGYPIHVNTNVKIGHHKTNVLTADLFRNQQMNQLREQSELEALEAEACQSLASQTPSLT